MKTKIEIEIETKDEYNIFPEESMFKEESEMTKEEKDEIKEFRENYPKDLLESVKNHIKNYIENYMEENFMDEMEELYIEGWEDFEDYGISIKIKDVKNDRKCLKKENTGVSRTKVRFSNWINKREENKNEKGD